MSAGATLAGRAATQLESGNTQSATALCRLALLRDPKDPEALRLTALIAGKDGDLERAEELMQAALAAAPHRLDLHEDLARMASAAGRPGDAIRILGAAVEVVADRMAARILLSRAHAQAGDPERGIATLREGLAHAPEHLQGWTELGRQQVDAGHYNDAFEVLKHAAALAPNNARMQANFGVVACETGKLDDSIDAYDRSLALDPDNAEVRMARSFTLLSMGRLEEGWRDYEARWRVNGEPLPALLRDRMWRGENLAGKRVVVISELGIGDQVAFSSCIPALIDQVGPDGQVVIECAVKLVDLFQRSFPTATVLPVQGTVQGLQINTDYSWVRRFEPVDVVTCHGDLPRYLTPPYGSVAPVLRPDPAGQAKWDAWLAANGRGKRIGLCWRSSLSDAWRNSRFPPVSAWRHLFEAMPEATFVNLQYDAGASEWDEAVAGTGVTVLDPPDLDQYNDLADTSDLMAALDLVISAPTAVAMLSAAVDTATLRLMRGSDWANFGGEKSPWFGKQKLVWLSREWHDDRDFQPVIDTALDLLADDARTAA